MNRRGFLITAAAGLARPHIARAAEARTLRFIPQSDLAVLDPVQSTSVVTMQHACMVFDTLYGVDWQGQTQPQMVDGHVLENDGRIWRMTLREGLRFHDGTPVLARDAAASIRRWGAKDAFGLGVTGAMDALDTPDDRTLVFRMKRPFPLLPVALGKVGVNTAVIMPERLAKTPPTAQVSAMVGSGPFRFRADERVPGSLAVYERFEGYVPRPSGTTSLLAGPKIAHLDRVEWHTIPDTSTASAALQSGEMDWWEAADAENVPVLRRRPDIAVRVQNYPGYAAALRPNCLQPPFDNPAIRRALMGAISQHDMMVAAAGEDPTLWRDQVGFFHPRSPMATDAGMEALTGPRDLDRVRDDLKKAGYAGQKVVLMAATDRAIINNMSEVAADMLRKVGINLDYQTTDFGSVLARANNREPVEKGGWSLYVSGYYGSSVISPAPHNWLRGNGAASIAGWPNSPRIEALRDQWFAASDLASEQAIAREMQVAAFQDVPYYPLGLLADVTAYRRRVSGILDGLVLFYNVRKD